MNTLNKKGNKARGNKAIYERIYIFRFLNDKTFHHGILEFLNSEPNNHKLTFSSLENCTSTQASSPTYIKAWLDVNHNFCF